MSITTLDLFRAGNATSARLDVVRAIDVDIYQVDGLDWVRGRSGGVSTFEKPDPTFNGRWWRLPKGSAFDDRILLLWNDQDDHWSWEPAQDMPLTDYRAALQAVNARFHPV